MNRYLASILSYVFHPLVITTYIFGLLLFKYPELVYAIREEYKLHFVVSIFVMTFVMPTIISFLLLQLGVISSMKMPTIQDRKYPLLMAFLIYAINAYLFFKMFQSDLLFALILGFIAINMLIVAIISLKWKISAHASGVGGLLAFYIVVSILHANQFDLYLCISILLIAGLTISARLELNSHNFPQVVAGFLLGLFTGLSCLLII